MRGIAEGNPAIDERSNDDLHPHRHRRARRPRSTTATASPSSGFGVFQIEPDETAEAVRAALEIGYRHIDTAQMYGNERGVGEAIRESGIPREEIWITSKLDNGPTSPMTRGGRSRAR